MSTENGWGEYSKLVLKELETLASGIDSLKNELTEVKKELAAIRTNEDKINELRNWKRRIDDIASPSQFKILIQDVQEIKLFKTKAITIFAVIQFLMATSVLISKFF